MVSEQNKHARLANLVKSGQLKEEPPTQEEFDGLLSSAKPRLKDAANPALSLESRFDLAYNAAHALSLAALRWHGYRSENRYIVFQCLPDTLALENASWRILDDAHRKRNNSEYSGIVDIEESFVKSLLEVTNEILRRAQQLHSLSN